MATEIFYNNANGPSNHHTSWKFFWSTADFIKIFEITDFPIGWYMPITIIL